MSNPSIPDSQPTAEPDESFGELLSQFEQSHSRKPEDGSRQIEGTVIAVSAESVFLDIGFKSEGILPLAAFQSAGEEVKPGDKLVVSVKGRDPDGYYELSRFKTALPRDWSALERAFADKSTMWECERSCQARAVEHATPPKWRSWWGRRFAAELSSST